MRRFTLGQVVRIKNPSDLGIILAECKEPEGHWCVALRTKEDNSIVAVYVVNADFILTHHRRFRIDPPGDFLLVRW